MDVRWVLFCYGWRGRSLEDGVATLSRVLGRRFIHRDGQDVGDYYQEFLRRGRERTGEITVLPNARAGRGEQDGMRRWVEPGYPDCATLVVVEGDDLSWWIDHEAVILAETGLERLYHEGLREAGRTVVYDREPLVKFLDLHEYCFGFGDTPMEEAAAAVGRALGVDMRERSDPFVTRSHVGEATGLSVEVLENGGFAEHARGVYASPWFVPEHPEHRVLLWANTSDAERWSARLARLTESEGAVLLRHDVTRSRV